MNRSIFPAFNLKIIYLNIFFSVFLYIFNFLYLNVAHCDELLQTIYKSITIRYSPSIKSSRLYNSVDFLQNYIINTQSTQFNLNIFKYLHLNGARFPGRSPYNHYHLNLHIDNIFFVHYNFQFTHHQFLSHFKPFTIRDLTDLPKAHYISKSLRVYDLDVLKPVNDTEKFINFIIKYNNNCNSQYKDLFK